MNRLPLASCTLALVALAAGARAGSVAAIDARHAPFVAFESGPLDSLLLTRDGTRLLALNTSDHRVEVFRLPTTLGKQGPTSGGSAIPAAPGGVPSGAPPSGSAASPSVATLAFDCAIFTGLEPVAMVQHPTLERIVFVSNHVSDSVAVVDLDLGAVVATIPIGDEPQGIAIANGRIFVACARAPVVPLAPGATLPGAIVENVVAVAQADPPYLMLGNVELGAMKPRAVVAQGGAVYVAIQNSGNHTTLLAETKAKQLGLEQIVPDAFDGGPFDVNPILLKPELNPLNYARGWYLPNAGRIVFDHEFPAQVLQLADRDVLAIDPGTLALTPWLASGVGTTLYTLAANPVSGKLWVANTDAQNRTRFEANLRGQAVDNRVTIVDPASPDGPHAFVDLAPPLLPAPAALPGAIAFSPSLAFVAAQGSSSVLVFDAASAAFRRSIDVGPIPSGLAYDAARGLLFVHTRGENLIRAYDGQRFAPVGQVMRLSYDPEPAFVRTGRLHLYDARAETGHGSGSLACASCHVFAHGDAIAWDLGDPEGALSYYFPDVLNGLGSFPDQIVTLPSTPVVHPMKGPMVTQSLRGLMDPDTKDDLPLHWRGDRRTFHQFRSAFRNLTGGSGVAPQDMQEFARFLRALRYAPNPFQPRDRAYVGVDASGADKFGMTPTFHGKAYSGAGVACIDCHNGDFFAKDDFTGGRPVASAGSFTQLFQTAQLRMSYEKHSPELTGFGVLHDGAVDGVRGFMDFVVPNGGGPTFPNFTTADKDEVASFIEHWDHGLSPLVGAQFTLSQASLIVTSAFLDLAEAQAKPQGTLPANVDLILKGWRVAPSGEVLPRGALFTFDATQQKWGYLFDTGGFIDRAVVLAVAQTGTASFTFTCVPPGLGMRLGIDRDEDGAFDFIERSRRTDPTRADSDGDGYTDGFELALGSDPRQADPLLPDSAPPAIELARALEIASDLATLEVVCDEPASLSISVGTTLGANDVGTYSSPTLRCRHDVILDLLPAGQTIHVAVTAADKNGNSGVASTSFTTLPPFLHVDSIAIDKTGSGPFSVTAQIRVLDRFDQPVQGVPLTVFFAGDLGGQAWQRMGTTGSNGVATILLQPYTPAAPTEVAVSVAWLGSMVESSPWFVGKGGAIPPFFYDSTENRASYAKVSVP